MITIEELRKLAGLARIEVPDSELEELRGQLDQILEFVGQVQKADVSSVPELTLPIQRNVFREDGEPHVAGLYTAEITQNFSDSDRGYLRVKKILDK